VIRTKIFSIVLTLAVCLGLLLVPAVSVTLAGGGGPGGSAGIKALPSKAKVGFNEAFTVNITIDNPANEGVNTVAAEINFTPGLISATGITLDPLWTLVTTKTYNNTAGTISIAAGIMGANSTASSIPVGTISMLSNNAALSGIAAINFVFIAGERETRVYEDIGGADILNWSNVTNATVKVGKAELTVDVNPALKGNVNIGGVGTPTSYPNVTKWDWDAVVSLAATPALAGWAFDSWTGDVANSSAQSTTITMNTDKSVTANFLELPPSIGLSPTSLSFTTYEGVNPPDQTFNITNTGGKTLSWAIEPRPTWDPGDWWLLYNYWGVNANNITMAVTGSSGCNYTASVDFTPPALRSIMGGMPTIVYNATVLVDKRSLDYVQQVANMAVTTDGVNWTAVIATVTWEYFGDHGWPYYGGKSWSYNVTQDVKTAVGGYPVDHSVTTAYATVTNFTSITTAGGLTFGCWEITHSLTPNPAVGTFMQTYWSDEAQNFVQQWDAGTFDNPLEGGYLDIRSLLAYSSTPPAGMPLWLSANPMTGTLVGNGAKATVTVSVDAAGAGLTVGDYAGVITVTDPCASSKTVDVSLHVAPATYIPSERNLPGNAGDYNQTYPGDTFNVYVNFTSSADGLNAIGLTDVAPDGWTVHADKTWCTPAAYAVQTWGNKVEIMWSGPYDVGQTFSAMYTVTVPVTAKPGINTWEVCPNMNKAWLKYYFGEDGPHQACISGDSELIVTVPGDVIGETRDVNAAPLSDVDVTLLKEAEGAVTYDASTPNYSNTAYRTGMYWEVSTKALYYTINMTGMVMLPANWIDLSTPALLVLGKVFDFEGNYGLVPRACDMTYAMKSVNLWLFPPTAHPEWGIAEWKAMDSIHSWQFPSGV